MDRSRFFSVIGRYKTVDNPISLVKVDQVIEGLQLGPGDRVLDIACGKAEMLCRIAERYRARCLGVERSPYFCEEANDKIKQRGLSKLVAIEQNDAQDYAAPAASYELTMCIGAEWIFGGWTPTLKQLSGWTKAGGTILAGTPFWVSTPPDEYLSSTGLSRDSFSSHQGNVAAGEALGLMFVYSVVSNQDDWDHYVGLSWRAAYDFERQHPDDPDSSEIAEHTAKDKTAYLGFGRDCINWAMYSFRKP